MRKVLWAALLAVGLVTTAQAQEDDEAIRSEPDQAKLTMVSTPTKKDDARFFPDGAPVSGEVYLRCTLTAEGRVGDCSLAKENPPGGGLLAVAMQEVKLFRFKPLDADGNSVAGRKVVLGQRYLAKGDADPEWVRKPTPQSLAAVFPVRAVKEGKNGLGVIHCVVTVLGALDRCRTVSETPKDYGFGSAALMLSSQFLMTPKIRGGVPVPGATTIPIHFKGLENMLSVSPERLISDPPWAKTPSAAQVRAAFPSRASEIPFGQVALRCTVTNKGGLSMCDVISENPQGRGFAAAARSLAAGFTIRHEPGDVSLLRNLNVDLPVRFRNPTAPDDGRLTDPRWTQTLSPAGAGALFPRAAIEKKVKSGLGVIDCLATAEGALTDCRVTREEPAALGFGEAALEASKVMRMNPWSKTGEPVEGRRLTLPIRLAVETLEPPPAQATTP